MNQNRRQMISGMTTLLAATVAGNDASAQATKTSAAGPFFVADAAARGDGPWVIQGTTPISVKISGADVGSRFTVIEVSTPPGRGPGLHVHFAQNEWFFLLSGSIGLKCGEQKVVLKPGDSFMVPMNTPHAYVTLGSEMAKIINMFDPAGNMEDFFKQYAAILNKPGPDTSARLDALIASHGGKTVGSPLRVAEFGV